MCGLAGFYRDPTAEGGRDAIDAFVEMLRAMQSRGSDATGFAILYDDGRIRIEKTANPAHVALASPGWVDLFERLDVNRVVGIIGHTRASSVSGTSKMDEAAHPFRRGKVVGAHNGMIYNWRQLAKEHDVTDWLVDSEAAFAMVDKHSDPIDGLNKLSGYWALTWFKAGRLHVSRAHGAPLSMAYVGSSRTLLWCSTPQPLERALGNLEWVPETRFSPEERHVYQYFAPKFTASTPSGMKSRNKVKGGHRASEHHLAITAGSTDHRMELPGPKWIDRRSAQRPLFPEDRLAELESTVETLKAEIAHLYKVMNEWNMFDAAEDVDLPDDHDTCTVCGQERKDEDEVIESDDGAFVHAVCVNAEFG